MNRRTRLLTFVLTCWLAHSAASMTLLGGEHSPPSGSESYSRNGWSVQLQPNGKQLSVRELQISPCREPRRPRTYRLLPDRWEQEDGNAAVYYLKAMGFFELVQAQRKLREIEDRAMRRSRNGTQPQRKYPPFSWEEQRPSELPVDEVREFLTLTDFQRQWMAKAWRQQRCDFEHDIRRSDDPYFYPLADMQMSRDLGRYQLLRCKLAIAEGRLDDAIKEIGYQLALAKHMGTDPIVVVGLIAQRHELTACQAALDLIEHPEAPNLYWAFASLPDPLISLVDALEFDRRAIYRYVPLLQEVDQTPRSPEYWRQFLIRSTPGFQRIARAMVGRSDVIDDPEESRLAFVTAVMAEFPAARKYLVEELRIPPEKVAEYSAIQTVLLAWLDKAAVLGDSMELAGSVPYWRLGGRVAEVSRSVEFTERDWGALLLGILAPGFHIVQTTASTRQVVAMIETVEAIRDQASRNGGTLPKTLEELTLKPPFDPATGKPFQYEVDGNRATLNGTRIGGQQRRIILHLRKK